MLLKKDYCAMVAEVTLEKDEELDFVGLDAAVNHVAEDMAGFWSVTLVLDARAMNRSIEALQSRAFSISGTEYIDGRILVRMKKNLRSSGDGGGWPSDPNLAVTANHPGQTREEIAAHETTREIISRDFSDDAVARKVAQIQSRDVDGHALIEEKSFRLAQAIIAGLERRPEPTEE